MYWYDAAGERTVKESFDNEGVYVNGALSGARTGTSKFTAYISPYMVVSQGGNYTKHVYMGSQRITSKVSNSVIFTTSPVKDTLQAKLTQQTTLIKERFDSLGVKYSGVQQTGGLVSASPATTADKYFYHPDHLGSSSLITNGSGDLVQHIQYVPFGEVFVEERNANWSTPYKFNGKEQDEETGLCYYGARYHDPRTSVWLSVDPLAEKYPSMSSYIYCANNPVKYIDPDGEFILGFSSSMRMNASNLTLGSGRSQSVYKLSYLSNNSYGIFSSPNYQSAGNFIADANIPDKIAYNSSENSPLPQSSNNQSKQMRGMMERMNNADRTGNAVGSAVEFVCKATAGAINAIVKNNYIDVVNSKEAFSMAFNVVMGNTKMVNEAFNSVGWSNDFKSLIQNGKFDVRNFQADVMNYIVDGNMNMDNFKLKGYGGDFNLYRNAVYQIGEQLLQLPGVNLNVPQQNTLQNNAWDTYINVGR